MKRSPQGSGPCPSMLNTWLTQWLKPSSLSHHSWKEWWCTTQWRMEPLKQRTHEVPEDDDIKLEEIWKSRHNRKLSRPPGHSTTLAVVIQRYDWRDKSMVCQYSLQTIYFGGAAMTVKPSDRMSGKSSWPWLSSKCLMWMLRIGCLHDVTYSYCHRAKYQN